VAPIFLHENQDCLMAGSLKSWHPAIALRESTSLTEAELFFLATDWNRFAFCGLAAR